MAHWFSQHSWIVISESDIEAALSHLRDLPHRNPMPDPWDRQRLLNSLRKVLARQPHINNCMAVAPGVFAIVKPFGADLAAHAPDARWQVWLLIRPWGTDRTRVTRLCAA
jgi:hypothetical protein